MNKNVRQMALAAYPPKLREIFDILTTAGAENFAVFGGALRDADYAARKNKSPRINDYDIRVWLNPDILEEQTKSFVEKLKQHTDVVETPSAGTGRIRYCMNISGAELDISVRPTPEEYKKLKHIPVEAVAIDRALDADIGLCSIAIDPQGRTWGTAEYDSDQRNDTLTVYHIEDTERRLAYAKRMQGKFPENKLIWLNLPPTPKFNMPMPP